MIENFDQKEFVLQPSWKYFFFAYIFSVLTIPVAGLGLVALYYLRKKHHAYQFVMQDDQIIAIDQDYEQHVDLADVENVEVKQSRLHEILEIGTLVLKSPAANLEILGIEKPRNIKKILEKAIIAKKEQEEAKPEPIQAETDYKPGARERINYLTGLWQQGLLSDQDYQKQKKGLE